MTSPTNPRLNPAIAVELTLREIDHLMSPQDWHDLVDRVASWPAEVAPRYLRTLRPPKGAL